MTYPTGWTGSLPLCPLIFSCLHAPLSQSQIYSLSLGAIFNWQVLSCFVFWRCQLRSSCSHPRKHYRSTRDVSVSSCPWQPSFSAKFWIRCAKSRSLSAGLHHLTKTAWQRVRVLRAADLKSVGTRSRVQILFCPLADVVLSSRELNFSAALVNSQLVCLLPVGILNLVMFIWKHICHCLFVLVLKSPNEWPHQYTLHYTLHYKLMLCGTWNYGMIFILVHFLL